MTILAPIQQHLDALATETGYPAAAVDACLARPEESAPPLRAILQRAARGTALSEAEAAQLFLGLHILAKLRDTKSFLPLTRVLHRPIAEVEDLIGDTVSETLPRVLASVFDGDAETLFDMIVDLALDEILRHAVWRATTTLTLDGRIARADMHAFALRFDAERLAPKGDFAWIGWLGAIANLGFADIAARTGAIWIDQRLPPDVTTRRAFDADLAAALRAPDDVIRSTDDLGLIDDVAQALSWADWGGPPAPTVNPMRHVGRNDPCPCGSGRKAKKCCLAAA